MSARRSASSKLEENRDAVAAAIDDLLRTQGIDDLVAAYFSPHRGFAVDTFDTLGDNDPYAITSDDLVVVTLLDVTVPPVAVRGLLGHDRGHVARLLHAIDPDVDLWEADEDSIGAANALWGWVQNEYPQVGSVIAGKLLARKRPRLIPIVDQVVVDTLRALTGTYWDTIAHALSEDDRRHLVDELRPGWLTPAVSTLRLLDVAIWMRGSLSEHAQEVRSECKVSEPPYRTRRGD